LIVQLAPPARVPAGLHIVPEVGNGTPKSTAFVPETVKPANVTVAVPVFETVTLCVALVVPTVCEPNVRLGGVTVTVGPVVPLPPCSTVVCGVPVALSVINKVAVLAPVCVGANSTPTTQTACAFNTWIELHGVFPGPVELSRKSSISAPVIVILLIKSAFGPVLFRNAYCGALMVPRAIAGKTSGFGSRLAVDAGIPVPLNPIVCGAPDALLLIVSVAKYTSVPVGGANVTLNTHTPPGVIVPLQLFVAAKAFGLVPLNGVVNVRFVFPMFCRSTNCALLVVPAVCLPKLRIFGLTVASVALAFRPVPVKKTTWGEVPVSLSATLSSPPAGPAAVGV